MSKAIAFPLQKARAPLMDRLLTCIHRWYRSQQCQNLTYETLMQKTITAMEEILDSHSAKDRFYAFDNVEIEIKAPAGLRLDISRWPTENIIMMLYKEAEYGQNVFSVVFSHKNGSITGIEYMTTGFCIDLDFVEQKEGTLNPEVLIELLVFKESLCRGRLLKLDFSNKKKTTIPRDLEIV